MRKLLLSLVTVLAGLTTLAASKDDVVLWEGSVDATWGGEPSVAAAACASFEQYGKITVEYTLHATPSGGYYSLGLIGNWRNYSWGSADGVTAGTNKKSYYLEDPADVAMAKTDGLKIMGNGLTVTKIVYTPGNGPIDKSQLLEEPVVVNSESASIEFTYEKLAGAGAVVGGGILVEYQILNPTTAYINFLHQGTEPTDPNDEEAVNAAKYAWVDFTDPKIVIDEVSTMDRTSLLVLSDLTLNEINSYSKNLIIQCGMVRVTKVQVLTPENMPELPEMSLVTLDKTELGLTVGATDKLVATIKPSTAKATWTTSDPAVATVDNEGNVTATGGGTATITCQLEDGTKATCAVTVAMIKIRWLEHISGQAIYGDEENITAYIGMTPRLQIFTIPEGKKVTLTATQAPENTASFYNYTGEKYTDQEAEFPLKTAGVITLTAKINGMDIEKTFTLTSVDFEEPCLYLKRSYTGNAPFDNILAGTSFYVTASVSLPVNGDKTPYKSQEYTWTVSDPEIAKVESVKKYLTSSLAQIIGLKSGTVTVNASVTSKDGSSTIVGSTELTFTAHGQLNHEFYFHNDRGGSWMSTYNIGSIEGNGLIENITLHGSSVDMILNSATTVGYIPKFVGGQTFTFKVTDPNVRILSIVASPVQSATALVTFGDKTTCSNGTNHKSSWSADDENGVEEVTFTVDNEKEVVSLSYWTPRMYRYATPELELNETEISGAAGETKQLTLDVSNKDTEKVLPATTKWTSADPAIASVDEDGLVTFVSKGSTEITADYNGSKAVCAVSVLGKSAIDAIGTDANNAEAEYFNLQGMRVDAANLTPGVYVMRKGNEVQKVVVK